MMFDKLKAVLAVPKMDQRAQPVRVEPSISYSIITAPRKPNYLPDTIFSLQSTGFFGNQNNMPLRIVGGSPDSSYLSSYSDKAKFLVDPMSQDEAAGLLFPVAGNALRAVFGHRRALHPSRVKPGSKYLLLMEDDIRFANGWMRRFRTILDDVTKNFGDRFLLSLYRPGNRDALEAYKAGKLWMPYPHNEFYGIQAVLYPVDVRDEFMFHTRKHEKLISQPHDLALGKNMMELGIPIISSVPSLVQHIGATSGANSPPHTTDSFLESVS